MSERRPTHWLRLALADLVGLAGDELEVWGQALQRRAALTYRRLYPDERPITERMAEQARKMEKEGLKKAPRPQDNPLLGLLQEPGNDPNKRCVCGHHYDQHHHDVMGNGCWVNDCSCTAFYDREWARSSGSRLHLKGDICRCDHHRTDHGRGGCTVDGCACPGTPCDGCRANRTLGVHL